jgi:hypothetical protein
MGAFIVFAVINGFIWRNKRRSGQRRPPPIVEIPIVLRHLRTSFPILPPYDLKFLYVSQAQRNFLHHPLP